MLSLSYMYVLTAEHALNQVDEWINFIFVLQEIQ